MGDTVGEKRLREVTCELIGETKITNELLRTVIEKLGGKTSEQRFKEDEQAFLGYWAQLPFRDTWDPYKTTPLTVSRQAWDAALAWERSKK